MKWSTSWKYQFILSMIKDQSSYSRKNPPPFYSDEVQARNTNNYSRCCDLYVTETLKLLLASLNENKSSSLQIQNDLTNDTSNQIWKYGKPLAATWKSDRMGRMAIGRIIVLSALIAQALSAPSGCIETCNFLQTNVRQTLGSYQDHANLVQGTTHLNDHDYTRPGNWTEHNQYNTDSGHGKVHEERGQYVEGSKRVRYYKKNFTSSYGTDNVHGVNAAELGELSGQHRYDSLHVPSNQHLDSQSAYDLGQTVIKETGYNRVHSQQTDSLSTRLNSKSEKLEDFGEYDGYSQVNQHIPSTNTHAIDTQHNVETVPNNWSRADSYRTDGGRGQVFEEEGQYVTGPKKVRYYQKNYTSSYSSGVPQSSGSSVKLDELHNEMQRNLQKDLDNFRRTFQVSSTGHTASTTHVAQLEFGQQTVNNPHLEDLTQQSEQFTQQTQGSDDFTQQTSGKLELGQQTVDNQHLDDLKQQSEQFTQQTEGQLEFGQQTVNNPHLENLTQQSEQFTQQTQRSNDFTQQTSGKLEFGQQTVDNQRLDNLKQQSEQFTQQTEGQLEFGQQTVNNPHLENLTQQNEQFTQEIQGHDHLTQQTSGKLELGQQTIDSQHLTQQSEQLTQQTEGQLEFGQQTVDNPHLKDLTQQNEQFTQQTQRLDHFTQTSGKLEFGQQTVDNHHLDDLTQQSEQFTQQTEGQLEFGQQTVDNPHLKDLTQQDSDGFSQQTSGKLEYGQQISNNQHLEDLMQQNQQFTQGSDDFTQQTSGKIIFGQQANDTQQLEQFTQRTARSDSLTQQIQLGKHEFGQQINNQHLEDPLRQSEQFAQTLRSDDFTQQSVGKLEFGQQTQSINKPAKPKSQRLEEFNEQNQDFTQQTGGFDDFTQQIGHLEFGQLQQPKDSNHHLEDFAQQNEDLTQQTGGFDDFSQQTAGHLYGQQREQQQRPSWPGHNTQHLKHYSQQNDWNTDDLSQQSRQYSAYNKNNKQLEWQLEQTNFERDFLQQTDQDQITTNVKPAPKPKPRPRYQKHDSIPPRTDRTDTIIDDVFKPVEVNPEPDIDNFRGRIIESGSRATYPESNHHTSTILYSTQGSNAFHNQRENIDRLHWVHNSNDATVGLQWHYTYHPSDLTNVEGSHDNYYPRHNVNSMSQQTEDTQQQFKPIDFHQQETQDKDRLENKHQNSYISQSSEHDEYNQQSESQQSETFRFDDQFNQDSEQTARVIPLQRNEKTQLILEQEKRSVSTTEQTENKPESRILQAYGGGPYASRSDDFYIRIRPNPSATLPPIDGDDSWDIREKPREAIIPRSTVHNTQEYITTTEVAETTTEITQTTIQPSFWSRVGHKITSTYDKAKEKAKEIFG
ncbi:hypothetical protein G5I_12244 [Acromyrmex echinatior]|uniref:Uncharacterized protein n=1 Tax=Acromyrmex echinatior TaxID=103372 RepID=F4X1S6_ACREC|nr:hypothetical protein G5I_12244 [Acromyrmex echinatior]